MSDEIAQIPKGDFKNLSPSSKATSDSVSQPTNSPESVLIDTTSSPRTENSRPLKNINQPSLDKNLSASGVNVDTVAEYTGPTRQQERDDLQLSQRFSDDPLKSSAYLPPASKPKLENSTDTSARPANSQGNRSRRGSKSSVAGKKRDDSVSSNRRSIQGQSLSAGAAVLSTTTTPPAVIISEKKKKPKKGGVSRLLSKLNCCGVPGDANAIDLDEQVIPARKPSKSIPSQARQTTPTSKPDTSAADSSTTESKEPNVEKIGVTPYSSLKPAAEPRFQEQQRPVTSKTKPTSQPTLFTNEEDESDTQTAPVITSQDSLVPPMDVPSQGGHMETAQLTDCVPQGASVVVIPPTPTVPIPTERQNAEQTPVEEAGDSDTVMVDAPPVEPVAGDSQKNVEPSEAETVPPLPPPPPVLPRTESSALGVGRNLTNTMASPNEQQKWLLPPIKPEFRGKKCLVLDLDETLVHSSFKILHQADFTIPVEIEGQYHNVYVIKRPGVDQFMKRVGELYEVVVFTASVSKYGDPLLDQLDIHHVVHHRLFRESCYNHQGNYVKDLSQVGRDLRETIIIDNSPTSYIFHPQHAVPISSWFSDAHDNELLDLIPVLEDLAGSQVRDVSLVLDVAL
ncbi:hypothetical protein MMC11_007547 [Xylographa trunciseda]|nr:hypothetical protein [Xylographa trunciseda]